MPDGKSIVIKILQEVTPILIDAATNDRRLRLIEQSAKMGEQTLEKQRGLLDKMWTQPQAPPETCRGCGKPSPVRQPVSQPTPHGVTGAKDPHYDYTVRQLVKNLALLQDHYTDYRCPECLPHDALIYTAHSIRKAFQQPISEVLTHEGRYQKVSENLKRHYEGDMMSIKVGYSNIPLRLTPEHPVLAATDVRHRQKDVWRNMGIAYNQISWVPASQLTDRDFVAFPRLAEVEDIPLITPDLAELFGWYLAEGCYYEGKRSRTAEFTVGRHEKAYADKIALLLKSVFGYDARIRLARTALHIAFYSKWYAPIFSEFGIGSHTKRLPRWALYLPIDKQHRMLEAMFRGDGSVGRYGITYATVSANLGLELRLLLFRLGYLHNVSRRTHKASKIEGRNIPSGQLYTIGISGDSAREFARNTGLSYDGGKVTTGNHGWVTPKYVMLPIISLKREAFKGWVYNWHVPGDESYVTVNGVVHNCIKKHLALIEGYAEEGVPMTQDPKEVEAFRDVAKWAQGAEGRTDYDKLLQEARRVRLSLTGREHGDTEK